MNIDKLDTGDILLFCHDCKGWFNSFLNMIKYATHSNYVHVGMIVKDPDFLDTPMKGIYMWESGYEGTPDTQDDKIKLGVQLTPINKIIEHYKHANILVRILNKDNNKKYFTKDTLTEIHKNAYLKPYDINLLDWVLAFFRYDTQKQKTSRFWCSAFVGYILTKSGILKSDTDWSIMYPCDFSLDAEKLEYEDAHTKYQPVEYKLNFVKNNMP